MGQTKRRTAELAFLGSIGLFVVGIGLAAYTVFAADAVVQLPPLLDPLT